MNIINAGFEALINYLTIHRLISLLIAFSLSGAIAQFMSQGAVLKYFGPKSPRVASYLVASVSGAILAVCSCSVLPMFASIKYKGAGIGPAITFLFSGPAINILAITMTFSLIGADIGFVRVISAMLVAISIGIIMSFLFKDKQEDDENGGLFIQEEENHRKTWQNLTFFINLVGILISGVRNPIPTAVLSVILLIQIKMFFEKEELISWGNETLSLAKKIAPLFIVGIFLAGAITEIIPPEFMVRYVGNNSYGANLMASIFGAFMYFATLTEVPIVNGFMNLGMLKGPATALLLAGPSLSLPNMIVITRVMGIKKSSVYISLVVLLSAFIAMLAGYIIY